MRQPFGVKIAGSGWVAPPGTTVLTAAAGAPRPGRVSRRRREGKKMEFEHSFTIPVPPDQAWDVLLNVERVAPCIPGASFDTFDVYEITGRVRVKVGPITMTYTGRARFVDRDPVAHTATLEASGKESRGTGTASATVHAALFGENGQGGKAERTRVTMNTTLNVTGRPAQMGRGVLADVSGKLVERFAANLAEQLSADTAPGGEAAGGQGGAAAAETEAGGSPAGLPPPGGQAAGGSATAASADSTTQPGTAAPAAAEPAPKAAPARKKEDETLDLLGVAAGPLMRRIIPAAGALAAAVLLGLLVRLRRRRRKA